MSSGRGEFAFIATLAKQLANVPQSLGLADDAAVLDLGDGRQLVIAADMVQAGVHTLADATPAQIASKALRTNLSDLAAMGAEPAFYLSTIAWPGAPMPELTDALVNQLAKDQAEFGIALIGGDTISTSGPMSISITVLGWAKGPILRRIGAQIGDDVWVSGSIGDGYLGLLAAQGGLEFMPADARDYLLRRYEYPDPRLALGAALNGVAHCGLDVSDGLFADAAHLAAQNDAAVQIDLEAIPLSPAAQLYVAHESDRQVALLRLARSGDDYELLFCAAKEERPAIAALAAKLNLDITRIGRVSDGEGVVARTDNGNLQTMHDVGFTHF